VEVIVIALIFIGVIGVLLDGTDGFGATFVTFGVVSVALLLEFKGTLVVVGIGVGVVHKVKGNRSTAERDDHRALWNGYRPTDKNALSYHRYYGCPKYPVITQAGMRRGTSIRSYTILSITKVIGDLRAALVVNVEHSWLNNDGKGWSGYRVQARRSSLTFSKESRITRRVAKSRFLFVSCTFVNEHGQRAGRTSPPSLGFGSSREVGLNHSDSVSHH
jgi:hypothetical protein